MRGSFFSNQLAVIRYRVQNFVHFSSLVDWSLQQEHICCCSLHGVAVDFDRAAVAATNTTTATQRMQDRDVCDCIKWVRYKPGDAFDLLPQSSLSLNVRRTRLSTVGDRAFPVARTWNSLPQHITSAPSIFSEVVSRLSSSGVPSHVFKFNSNFY